MLKKIIHIIIFSCWFIPAVNGQTISRSSIASAGGTLTGGAYMISYNIGGTVNASLSSGSNMITQGFEQPGEELHTGTVISPICPGSNISVPYTAIDIGGGNIFTVQLSDAFGNFTSPVDIGTATGNASGSISVTIPANITAGSGYRVRLVSNSPPVNGTDNGTGITIDAVLLSLSAVINNTCHAGTNGSITTAVATTPLTPYAFSITGPTINNTGETSGIFTGLSAGNYTISILTQAGCSSSIAAIVTEPPGTLPDISLGADYSSNFFTSPGTETNIVYNISEVAGNASTGDTIRVFKVAGYSFEFDENATTINIGSTSYPLDNSHWKMDDSAPAFISLILDPAHNGTAGTLSCGGRVYVSLKLKRNTPNISTFALGARLRRSNAEINIGNNLSSIVFTAE